MNPNLYIVGVVFAHPYKSFSEEDCVQLFKDSALQNGNLYEEADGSWSCHLGAEDAAEVVGYTFKSDPRLHKAKLFLYIRGFNELVVGALLSMCDVGSTYIWQIQLFTPHDDKPVWEVHGYPDAEYGDFFERACVFEAILNPTPEELEAGCEDFSVRSNWRDGWNLEALLKDSVLQDVPDYVKTFEGLSAHS